MEGTRVSTKISNVPILSGTIRYLLDLSSLLAILNSQCFSDGFQRAFPNYDAAVAAWGAFMRDGTFPDYGRSPWVVYLGRRPGVFTRV